MGHSMRQRYLLMHQEDKKKRLRYRHLFGEPYNIIKEGQYMKQLRVLLAFVVLVVFAGLAFAGSAGDESLQKLMDGNKRYVDGKLASKDLGDSREKRIRERTETVCNRINLFRLTSTAGNPF